MKNKLFFGLAPTFVIIFTFTMLNNSFAQNEKSYPDFTPRPDYVIDTDTPVINLNGSWLFSAEPGSSFWRNPKIRNAKWAGIQVPGEWLMQGFEVEVNTMAAYSREVQIPDSWSDKNILLKCDGVFSLSKVFINGKLAGSHEGGLTPFQLDLTKLLKPGRKNTIIIGVQSESLADTLASTSQYAAHQLGGITRKLELYVVPETYVKSLVYTTHVLNDRGDAELLADVVIVNKSKKKAEDLSVKINLKEDKGLSILIPDGKKIKSILPGEEINYRITIPVKNASLWDPEHPNLYDVDLNLFEGGEKLQQSSSRIGIREVEIVGNQVFVNGKPIKLRGVNRHEVHPTKGRSLSIDEWRADVKLFKEANVNYIRTSHYPPAHEFVSLCDSIGLFVECEAPLCWIGHHANAHWMSNDPHDENLYPLMRQLVMETVFQYRNHPSIIIWSMANESAWGPNWARILDELKVVDPSRPISFHDQAYGGFNNHGSVDSPIANIHYPGPAGPEVAWKFDRPLLFGEYAHLNTYNRQEIVTDPGVRDAWGRGLESMWENMYHSTGCLGGAIWSGIDDVFYLPSGVAVGYGEWGPIDGWRRPKPEYYHLKKIYSPIKVTQQKVNYPENGEDGVKIALENRQLFSNMNEVDIRWEIDHQSGKATMNLEPRKSGILNIYPDESPVQGEPLKLSFYSPQGFLIDSYLLESGDPVKHEVDNIESPVPELIVNENAVSVTMDDEVWLINAVDGKLKSVRKGNLTIIEEGPELMLLPLRTGPCNTEHSLHIETLNETCLNWKGKVSGTGSENGKVYIEVEGSYDEADIKLTYWFGRSSGVEIEYEVLVKSDIDPRQIGLVFAMPRNFEKFSWERKGQWNLYPETHLGRSTGSVIPFPSGQLLSDKVGEKPSGIWEADFHPMGINDFRATRDKLVWGSLENSDSHGIKLVSDSNGAMRPFVHQDKIFFLAAGFSTAGGDLFFSSHLRDERKPLKKGETFKSSVVLEVH